MVARKQYLDNISMRLRTIGRSCSLPTKNVSSFRTNHACEIQGFQKPYIPHLPYRIDYIDPPVAVDGVAIKHDLHRGIRRRERDSIRRVDSSIRWRSIDLPFSFGAFAGLSNRVAAGSCLNLSQGRSQVSLVNYWVLLVAYENSEHNGESRRRPSARSLTYKTPCHCINS